ncbi:MAG: PstS family phosphate ABC transporter substrate-binding protein [Candidatus Peribacteraceae bacterium]|nr:PstS family phosphate ABC transporter substrate-binding protein [Candidatus Peribacteraceae bacterium]
MKKILLFATAFVMVACSSNGVVSDQNTSSSVANNDNQSLVIKGSDTEVQLVSNLAEAFGAKNPGSDISVTGGGSATGIASLLNEEIDLANSSRAVSQEEKETAAKKGLTLHEFILAKDGLSVIVHPSNKLASFTLQQLSDIYSGTVKNWKDLGGKDAPIVLYGRQSTSGTYKFFRDTVVKKDYASDMRNMEGSQAIVDAVKTDVNGIGYVGVGYIKDETEKPRTDIAIIPVQTADGTPVSPLDEAAVKSGKYPIARDIYQYFSASPKQNALLTSFLVYEASPEGQEIIKKAGFYTLSQQAADANTALLSAQ